MKEYFDLDIEDIKTNIKTFFEASTEFQDYNFDGSALTQLNDLLAYITQYSSFYLNQTVNELTLKNAEIRQNVLELSNMLNYLPGRKSTPYIDLTIQRTIAVTIVIPKFSEWKMGSIYLTNIDDITLNTGAAQDIRLYEGVVTTETFISDGTDFQTYELANTEDVDNDYLYVYNDIPDGVGGYTLGTTAWVNVNKSSFVTGSDGYYIEYFDTLSIKFDDGNLFNKPAEDDRVRIFYILTNGTTYNGSTGTITCTDGAVVNNDKLTITPITTLINGVDEESSEAIKLRAPLYYTTQGRAITEDDYQHLFYKWSKYSLMHSTNCWGGEKEWLLSDELVESSYIKDLGHVYISTIKTNYDYLTTSEVQDVEDFFDPYKVQTIFTTFLDPVFVTVIPTVNIEYETVVGFDLTAIETLINTYLVSLNGYKKTFYLSEITSYIQDLTNINYNYMTYTTYVTVKHQDHKVIRLNNAIDASSINGTINGFTISDDGIGGIDWNGSTIGSVNYTTGFITLDSTFGGLTTTDTYDFGFTYTDLEQWALIKESFLKFDDINLNTL